MISQGEIYSVNLSPTQGHEQSGLRPVLIIQNDHLNRYLSTAVIIPLSGNLDGKGRLSTYFLEHNSSGLKKDSILLLFQIKTIDKSRLIKKIGKQLSPGIMQDIKNKLQEIF